MTSLFRSSIYLLSLVIDFDLWFDKNMAAGQVVMRAKYKTSVKDPGIQGVLKMTWDKFTFATNDPRSSVKLDVGFKSIKGHKFSKEGSKRALLNLTQDQGGGYIFEFDKFPDRDVCRDFVGKVLGKLQSIVLSGQDVKVVSERSPATVQDEQLSPEEMERRMKLLRDDSELQKLHKQFVITGILTEAEFWATRKKLLDADGSKTSKQQVGFKSAMLADVRPLTDGRTNKVLCNFSYKIIAKVIPARFRVDAGRTPSRIASSSIADAEKLDPWVHLAVW
ncbi:general transcription and DNA repair factor IIH subunit TFB1-1-like [Telopea speciosissima]|uniref:general transcription and DNA repair factor IIH subunit TFB1-1-like n=1 Tax=Telopea speciosissima TaxID=54955 RepID=UPI001CC440BD|nr:general transcription and DNA repair factor IIH subunit TFB1-1-like [Telopea speciosissima]